MQSGAAGSAAACQRVEQAVYRRAAREDSIAPVRAFFTRSDRVGRDACVAVLRETGLSDRVERRDVDDPGPAILLDEDWPVAVEHRDGAIATWWVGRRDVARPVRVDVHLRPDHRRVMADWVAMLGNAVARQQRAPSG